MTALLAAAVLPAAAACGRDTPAPRPPSVPPVAAEPAAPPAPPAAAPAAAVGWDDDAGLALLVPGPSGEALLVAPGAPDSAGVDTAPGRPAAVLPARVALYAPRGLVGHARASALEALGSSAGTASCAGWPTVRVGPASGADAMPAWTVGFAVASPAAAPAALPLDSLEALPAADSAALAAAVTRLAAALPEPAGVSAATRGALRGVPFRVRSARRFTPDPATTVVVAALTRMVNQEATPAADLVLLVAERPAAAGRDAAWTVAYHERATGREETLPAAGVLAAVRLAGSGTPRAALIIGREADEGSRYALLERVAPARWTVRWTSARPGCAGEGRR